MIRGSHWRLAPLVAVLFASIVPLTGCEQGPAEKAGSNIDKGIQNAKDTINPPGPVEKAGREVDKALPK